MTELAHTDYKFRSEITKSILPLGVVSINQVSRCEVSAYLMKIKIATKNRFGIWGQMFFGHCVGEYLTWGEDTILVMMNELKSDIQQLTALLYVKKKTNQ